LHDGAKRKSEASGERAQLQPLSGAQIPGDTCGPDSFGTLACSLV